jgi:hypothetical protein
VVSEPEKGVGEGGIERGCLRGTGVWLNTTNRLQIFHREEFECSQHKGMVHIPGDR